MRATWAGTDIPLSEITLDPFGWTSPESVGRIPIAIHLNRTDLLEIGREIYRFARECLDGRPDYFASPAMTGVPVPDSDEVFVRNPELLESYLRDSFWDLDAITAVLDRPGTGIGGPAATYWVERLKGSQREDSGLRLDLGAATPEPHQADAD